MKYVAIDVETTGLYRANDQILEFAAVFATLGDNSTPIEDLPIYHAYIDNGRIEGNPFALNMNKVAIERLALRPPGFNYVKIEDLAEMLHKFIITIGGPVESNSLVNFKAKNGYTHYAKLVIAGKNFAAFDAHFVERIPDWAKFFRPHHRSIDPSALFLEAGDDAPPDLSTCLRRAGLPDVVKHEAASDAFAVVELLRSRYGVVDTGEPEGDAAY